MPHTTVRDIGTDAKIAEGFAYGVSLHSHTSYSRENLEFIPKYARRSPVLRRVMDMAEWQYLSRTGNTLDCSRAWWTPPLSPATAVRLETAQIGNYFQLPAMVSLTDHDCCRAGFETGGAISIEWTIPCAPSFFHLGVHNLPRESASKWIAEMHAFTANPDYNRLGSLLETLNAHRDVLIVFNHPLWDEGLIGGAEHARLAEDFLTRFRLFIHALELNGLRSVAENEIVEALAERYGLPSISGGDRHGREPNANVNLTYATTFAEFAAEVRDGWSHVVYMPQYREPLRLRQFETAWDILRYHPDFDDGRRSWCDRVFFTCERGYTRPLSFYFGERGPKILLPFLAAMHLLEAPVVRPVLRAAFGG